MIMAAYTKLGEDTEMLSKVMSGELDTTEMTELMKPYFEEAIAAAGDEMAAAYSLAEAELAELNSEISAMEGGNIHVVDVYGAFKGHAAEYTNITAGDIHPSAAGHAVIAELLANELSGSEAASDDTYDAEFFPVKPSPETRAEGVTVMIGAAALAGAAVIFLGKKSRR